MRKETGLRTAAVLGIACLVLLVLGLRWHPLWGAVLAAGGCAGISLLLAAGPAAASDAPRPAQNHPAPAPPGEREEQL